MLELEKPTEKERSNMMNRKRILIISDDTRLVGFLHDHLSVRDYQIASTGNGGEELKEILDSELPDLVILDIIMPWMDGIELCLRIRQWCPVPVLMLSTWGAIKGTVRGLDLGNESYLTEPFDVNGLMTRVESVLYRN